ncbi:MAG: hypothetical protein ABFC96_18695, partial [Thermoguttaceae bacterium]
MPVADLPPSDEITAFRRRLQEIIDGRFEAREEDESSLCSNDNAETSRSACMTAELAPPPREPSPTKTDSVASASTPGPIDRFLPPAPKSLRELGSRESDIQAIILKFLLNS